MRHAQSGLNSSNAGKFERESARVPREAADIVQKLKECASELEKLLGDELLGLLLFGSWARGEAREDSDVDVFIVLKSLKGVEARALVYKVVAERVKRAVTLVDARADELFKEELELTPLLLNILVDGVVVYDRTGKLAELASKARRLVEEMSLVRYRTPDGKYGWERRDSKPLVPVRPSGFNPLSEVGYGVKLAERYLADAEGALRREDFRGAVAASQLAAENAAKAVVAVYRIPSWSHDPSHELREVAERMPPSVRSLAEELASITGLLAPEHGRATYGEPPGASHPGRYTGGRTPKKRSSAPEGRWSWRTPS
jgi:predicted nucleotidyltransferase/HEPN domain-containing protein